MALVWGWRWSWLLGMGLGISGCARPAPQTNNVEVEKVKITAVSPSEGVGDAVGREAFGEAMPRGVILLEREGEGRIRDVTVKRRYSHASD